MNSKAPLHRAAHRCRAPKTLLSLQLLALAAGLLAAAAGEIEVLIPDYIVKPFGAMDTQIYEIEINEEGVLHILTGTGVYQMKEGRPPDQWSSVAGSSLVFAPDGSGYMAARHVSNQLLRLDKSGHSQPLTGASVGVLGWFSLAVTEDGRLYGYGSPKESVFIDILGEIDTFTGNWTLLHMRGGDPSEGRWLLLASGPGNTLYRVGVDNSTSSWALYQKRRDAEFAKVAVLPIAMVFLAVDDKGVVYGGSNDDHQGTVWRIDPITGISELLAQGFSSAPSVAFDRISRRLFVAEQLAPFRITAISIPPDACVPSPRASVRTSEVEITWPSQSNRVYNVEFRPKIDPSAEWLPLFRDILGTGRLMSVQDKVPSDQPLRVYRVACATNQPPSVRITE